MQYYQVDHAKPLFYFNLFSASAELCLCAVRRYLGHLLAVVAHVPQLLEQAMDELVDRLLQASHGVRSEGQGSLAGPQPS